MDLTGASVLINVVIGKVVAVIQEGRTLRKDLKEDLGAIEKDLNVLNATIEDESAKRNRRNRVGAVWIRQVQDLAYAIEDCLDRHRGDVRHESDSRFYRRWLGRVKTVDPRTKFAEEIKALRAQVEQTYQRRNLLAADSARDSSNTTIAYNPEPEIVGIAEPKKEVLGRLLLNQPKSLEVVSIVGPRGLGKTALVRAVYDSLRSENQFHAQAWIVASDCTNTRDLHKKILEELKRPAGTGSEVAAGHAEPCISLRAYLLKTKRYFIVLDDLQKQDWDAIKSGFPDNALCGRVIVTTNVEEIAKGCISEGASVYRMQALSQELSRNLFLNKVFGPSKKCPDHLQAAAHTIVDKCGGLPLALVSIAQYLMTFTEDQNRADEMKNLCSKLGTGYFLEMENLDPLKRMKQAFDSTFYSLPYHDLKNCLLSVSIFPEDHPIKKTKLIRRWLAEGLIGTAAKLDEESKAYKYFEELLNRNVIIQAVDGSSNAKVKKSCRIHGIMLEFIVHKSVSENFITLVHQDTNNPPTKMKGIRRLSLQKTNTVAVVVEEEAAAASDSSIEMEMNSPVRSLAIFNHDGSALLKLKFQRCKLLRALDLEDCKGLGVDVLDSICELLNLKYLSLRGCTDVRKLPKKMYKLKVLETLDIRKTGVSVLPMRVLNLPQLVHLFGDFHLPKELTDVGKSISKTQKVFAEKSKLQTLSGFVMDDQCPGFIEHIMGHMKKLKKVKVRFGDAPPAEAEVSALKIQLNHTERSLSVDFGDNPTKLQAKQLITALLGYIGSLNVLSLQLRSVDLHNQDLANLGKSNILTNLKIADGHSQFGERSFSINSGEFPSLASLCFETPKLRQVSIEVGAMPKLKHLQLFCEGGGGLDIKDWEKRKNLKVTSSHSVPAQTNEA